MFWLKGEIEKTKITLTKGSRKKVRNQKNEDQIKKYNTIIMNWRMKSKSNSYKRKKENN